MPPHFLDGRGHAHSIAGRSKVAAPAGRVPLANSVAWRRRVPGATEMPAMSSVVTSNPSCPTPGRTRPAAPADRSPHAPVHEFGRPVPVEVAPDHAGGDHRRAGAEHPVLRMVRAATPSRWHPSGAPRRGSPVGAPALGAGTASIGSESTDTGYEPLLREVGREQVPIDELLCGFAQLPPSRELLSDSPDRNSAPVRSSLIKLPG